MVNACEQWLAKHYWEGDALQRAVQRSGLPERTLKRRFKAATGTTNLRINEAKRLLECQRTPVDEISAQVGYEDTSFFRRLSKRRTGLNPRQYGRLFQPIGVETDVQTLTGTQVA